MKPPVCSPERAALLLYVLRHNACITGGLDKSGLTMNLY
jgi:hypothetical protein